MRVLRIGWISLALLGQEPPQTKIETLMARAAEQQREAVRKQTSPAGTADTFFLYPAFLLSPPEPLGAPAPVAATAECRPLGDAELKALAAEAAQAAGVKPEWLLAVVADKSQGRPCALSPAGAVGLMQLAPATVDQMHLPDPFDPQQNLAAGARLLAELLARSQGDFARARAAYDGAAGPAAPGSLTGANRVAPTPLPSQNQPSTADKNQ